MKYTIDKMLNKIRNWIERQKDSFTHHVREFENSLTNAKDGRHFIEMRLPIYKITKEFESALRKKYEHVLSTIKIREAHKKDVNIVRDLYNISWSTATMPFNPIQNSTLLNAIKNPDITILIASQDSEDVGFIILKVEKNHEKVGNIIGIGILSEFRYQGIGTALAIASWDFFKKKNVSELKCKVFSENKSAYKFMTRLGFEEIMSPVRPTF
ncbi:MAG: GNAT family N-acetyltransferase [Promethearchaeota archaeon]